MVFQSPIYNLAVGTRLHLSSQDWYPAYGLANQELTAIYMGTPQGQLYNGAKLPPNTANRKHVADPRSSLVFVIESAFSRLEAREV